MELTADWSPLPEDTYKIHELVRILNLLESQALLSRIDSLQGGTKLFGLQTLGHLRTTH